jgi:aryl-alcohol dehydrogenase-like predicted oxidoreductase
MLSEHDDRARMGFGCVRLGNASGGGSWRSQVRLVQRAIDQGVTAFDTADAYGNGLSEQIIGRAVRGRRSQVEIATKVGYQFRERGLWSHTMARLARPVIHGVRNVRSRAASDETSGSTSNTGGAYSTQDFSPEYLQRAVDASLRRLGTDYIDILQLHGPRAVSLDIVDVMARLKAAGKIRRFGIGAESLESAVEWLGIDGVDTMQVPFGVLDPQAATAVLPLAASRGVDVWARGVLGGGLLSMAMADDPRLRALEKWPLIGELMAIAARHDVPVVKLAVEYVRSFSGVSVVLLGIQSDAHLSDNVATMNSPTVDSSAIDDVTSLLAQWVDDHEIR